MNARAISFVAAGALLCGSVLAAPAVAGSRDYGGWRGGHGGWHHHHRFVRHYGFYQPVFYGYGSFPGCHWVKTWRGLIKVCNGFPY
jgi:hypothetical protein